MDDEMAAADAREPADTPPQRLAGPLLFSVGLHAGLLLLFMRTVFTPSTDLSRAEERPSIRVALALRAPRVEAEPPVAESVESSPPEPVEAPNADTPPEAIADAALVDADAEADADAAPAESLVPPETQSAEAPATSPGIQAWTPARVRAAVQSSTGALRSRLTGEWMEACILERKERGTRDCEQGLEAQEYLSPNAAAGRAAGAGAFAGVTRSDRQWLLAEQFKKDNDTLRGLMNDAGVVGELATSRYYLNRDYIIYLSGNRVNGNHNDMVFAPMQNFTADELGGPQLILNGDTPFQCGAKKMDYGLDPVTGRATFGNIVPCIYEFTGFTIERPEADPNEFRVVPTLFGSQR